MTARLHRPALDQELDQLAAWFSPERFRVAINFTMVVLKEVYEEQHPSYVVVSELGRDERTIRRWKHKPMSLNRLSLDRVNEVFGHYLGEDWCKIVDQILERKKETDAQWFEN